MAFCAAPITTLRSRWLHACSTQMIDSPSPLLALRSPMPTYFRFDQVPDPWSAVTIDVCKTYTTPETPPNSQPTRDCLCTNCLDLVHQCDSLQGCREIVQCASQVGCNSIITCYLLPQPTAKDPSGKACQAVIDKWGNSGFAAYLANRIQECSTAASCPAYP